MLFILEYLWTVIIVLILAYPFIWVYYTAKEFSHSYLVTRWFLAYPAKLTWAIVRAILLLFTTCIPFAIFMMVIAFITRIPIDRFDWLGYSYVYLLFGLSIWRALKDIKETEEMLLVNKKVRKVK